MWSLCNRFDVLKSQKWQFALLWPVSQVHVNNSLPRLRLTGSSLQEKNISNTPAFGSSLCVTLGTCSPAGVGFGGGSRVSCQLPALQRPQRTCLRCSSTAVDDETHCLFLCEHPTIVQARDVFLSAVVPPVSALSSLRYADFWALYSTGRVPLPVLVKTNKQTKI